MNTKRSWSRHLSTKNSLHVFLAFLFNYFPIFSSNRKASGSKHFFKFYTSSLCGAATVPARSKLHTHHLPWKSWGALWTLRGINKYSGMWYTNARFSMNFMKHKSSFFPLKRRCDLLEHLLQLPEGLVVPADLCSLEHQEAPEERRNKVTHCRSVIQLHSLDCDV